MTSTQLKYKFVANHHVRFTSMLLTLDTCLVIQVVFTIHQDVVPDKSNNKCANMKQGGRR